MRLASQQRALEAPTPSARHIAEFEKQSQGTIYDPMFDEEKKGMPKEQEAVNFEVLPTYEEAASTETPRGTAPQIAAARPAEATYVPANISRSLTSRGLNLNDFNAALTSYREGDCCGKGRARRAAKNLVRELVSEEIGRRQVTSGSLSQKQRKQVRRDFEPVLDSLKDIVRNIQRE